jgi:oxygen-independent coproporphyrinogen-3 oxidase
MNRYPLSSGSSLWADYRQPDNALWSVYLHVPFCIRHCNFCHLPVVLAAKSSEKSAYIDALFAEIDLQAARMGFARFAARDLLFGGGTPTHLDPELLDRFLRGTLKRIDTARCSQISVDLDPATVLGNVGLERLTLLREAGVSRLAFGVEDLDDDVASAMGRAHDGAGAEIAIGRALDLGFKVNIEFICGYPGQTLAGWIETIRRALALGVDEIQIYRLEVTPYRSRKEQESGVNALPADAFPSTEQTIQMLAVGIRLLEDAGYSENRRRFYTKTLADYSHYQDSWTAQLRPQIGFGQTALSNLPDRVVQNHADLAAYSGDITSGLPPVMRGLKRSVEDQVRWAFCMPLRHYRAQATVFEQATGRPLDSVFRTKVLRLKEEGLIEDWAGGLKLSRTGAFWANQVIQQFHDPRYLAFPEEAYSGGRLNPYRDNRV